MRVMANAIPHTLFQWSLLCLQFILLFLSFMVTLLSYYTLVFCFTLLLSPCVGTIQFLHKCAYIHCLYSVSGLSWYQHQSLATFCFPLCLWAFLVHDLTHNSVRLARDSLIPPQIPLSVFSSPREKFTLLRFYFILLLVTFLFYSTSYVAPQAFYY